MPKAAFGLGGDLLTSLCFDTSSNAAWFATATGDLGMFRVLGQRVTIHGTGWPDAVAVLPSVDGLSLRVVVRTGEVFVASHARCNRAEATVAVSLAATIVAADRLDDDGLLVLDSRGRLHRVEPASGRANVWLDVDPGARLLSVDRVGGEVLVGVESGAWELRRFRIDDGTLVGAAVPVPRRLAAIAARPDGDGLWMVDDAGEVTALRWSGAADPFSFVAAGASALGAWHSLVMVGAGTELHLCEWGDEVEILPLACGFDPIAVGGWASMTVDYAAIGLTPDEVEWRIREGVEAGSVSVARPPAQPSERYEHRVMSGIGVPEFHLEASERSTGTLLATRRFRVVERWPDTRLGPPIAVTGVHQVYAKPGWGGGPGGPQNIAIHPAPSEFRIAFVVFRTKGAVSSVDAAARVSFLRGKTVGGGLSAKTYYEEVSFRGTWGSANPKDPKGTTLELLGDQVFGPIDLDYAWGDLFGPGNKADPWAAWNPHGGTWDLLGGAFSTYLMDRGLADAVTRLADAVVFAVLPGTDAPYMVGTESWSAQWSWAFAADAQHYWKTPTSATFKRIPSVLMPAAMPAGHPAPWSEKEWVSTICHELGHTLGCPDLYSGGGYPAELAGRYIDAWDLMASDAPLPHFSLAHRMRLGWINPDWIEVCDFGLNPANRTVTLESMETLKRTGPSPGRKAGIEIRIRDGWNYYFEYRRARATQIGDRELPSRDAILGTDLAQAGAEEMTRPLVLLLPDDVDGDGSVLRTPGQDYEESDVTNPDRMNDFRITRQLALPLDRTGVSVEIQYVGAHRPELQITPAPGRNDFKSPDIDVDGPAGPNIVVKGRMNSLRIRVHNRGTKAADAVRVRVKWLPFTTAPGTWQDLGSPPTQTIPARSNRTFTLPWQPPATLQLEGEEVEHFCVRVDVDRYVDPTDPAGSEIVVHNNWAQSNFATSAVGHGFPSERRTTFLRTTNRLPVGALHALLVEQSSEYFRSYVDHAWRWLAPGETVATGLSFESLAGDPVHGPDFARTFLEWGGERMVNDLRARTFILPDLERDGAIERSGIQLLVRAGLRTFVDRLEARGELVQGGIQAGDAPGAAVDSGQVRVIVWPRSRPEQQVTVDAIVEPDGGFRALLSPEIVQLAREERLLVEAYYLGTIRFAPCRSRTVGLRID